MKSVCVFCGSSRVAAKEFLEAARRTGNEIAGRKLRLVYGGAKIGLMQEVAEGALEEGGEVIGVIPERMVGREIAHDGLTELIVTDSMHERKMKMAELADAFIALPGGLGTLEEIFEAITWAQLQLHAKPCGFLNVNRYFDKLLEFLDHCVEEGFIRAEHRVMLLLEEDPRKLLEGMVAARPVRVDKWVRSKAGTIQ
jgi:uncharacterized protein (TIGR00730 family)